ncbi:chromosome segregation protein ScpA [Rufibacter radiotolerans]|uniref:Segregation and condensation protein A n=1 Tax=Rufibacter radiotolerans TaxID=1379910 RepID=A0A0H4VFS6_9BACT|nr:segregation/condensation protein A [Rufibacter radiotolerans]AKQ44475.1 chromosome segregation protein ScpA [Rufibacter radiotolerans]
MSFEIKLSLFEGPFDLLLFFIERDELDIHDIPIFQITNDFVGYIRQLETMNMEVASEFILTAATLMRIKAKMLLPRFEKDAEGNEIDPRQELVQHLLEYKRYKEVLGDLSLLEDVRLQQEQRGNTDTELSKIAALHQLEYELKDLNLYHLMQSFHKAMQRYEDEQNRPKHTVYTYPYTIDQQRNYIKHRVSAQGTVQFSDLIDAFPDKIGLIFNFLAILDLLQLNEIGLEIADGFNNFRIVPYSDTQHLTAPDHGSES